MTTLCCCVVLTLDQSVATATTSTLHEACRLGDADETQRLLDAGTNINARDQVPHFVSFHPLIVTSVATLWLLCCRLSVHVFRNSLSFSGCFNHV